MSTTRLPLALDRLRTIAAGLDHPEGINRAPDGALVAGGEAGQVYRVDPDSGRLDTLATTGGFVLGVATDAAGLIYACDWGSLSIRRIDPRGVVEEYSASAGGAPYSCPNYCAFDDQGWLWVSDSGDDRAPEPQGRIVRIPPGGGDGVPLELDPLWYPNGLAFDADGRLLVIESFERPSVSVLEDGALSRRVDLPGTVPDGIAIAESGAFYVSNYQPNTVLRVAPGAREPELVLSDWTGVRLMSPTNVCFFGDGLRELAIASLHGWDIKAVSLEEPGLPLRYPEVPRRADEH